MAILSMRLLRQAGKKRFVYLPTACTLINALFGFLAVVCALEGDFLHAAYCIMGAAFMDMIDGRIARFFRVTTPFGMELDSLCDAVSFCYAPAVVLYCWALHTQGISGLCILACYLWAGLFRLARFNISAIGDARYSIGLPTTFAALSLATVVTYMPSFDPYCTESILYCRWSMLLVALLSFLMVSKIGFPTGKSISISHTYRRMRTRL